MLQCSISNPTLGLTDSKAASQNSATVQAQAGLEIEVVDFSRGGVGHRGNWETGRLLSLGTPRAGWFISNGKKHG